MDSREPPQPPPRSQQQPSPALPSIMVPPRSFSSPMPSPVPSSMISPNSSHMLLAPATARLPFTAIVTQSRIPPPPPPPPPPKASELTSPYEGSSAYRPGGLSIDSPKRKRGRPRKYSPDGSIALGLAPTPLSSSGPGDLSASPSGEPPAKKSRGRPPGSGKKQMDALGAGGTCFTPHVLLVKTGEDIGAKIMAFCEEGSRSVFILSANGAICNATIRQPATAGGTVYYEGRYEIISICGSFNPSEDGGSRTGGLSVALAAADGRIVGGSVSGMLIAASPIQVILGSFIAEGKKQTSSKKEESGPSSATTPTGTQLLNFGASSVAPTRATSQGVSSDSSDEDNDGGSTLQMGSGSASGTGTGPGPGPGPGVYNSVSQPIRNMPWSQLWTSHPPQR
ncbi:AT-hook motif nuclear-localized protein 10-like [Prosopis cineraria]|uniref:AT-hook motif nuclear-localized protein 10-like n=1 Tax=Prosopis cineraria TaxID=364024 RepID=UPI00240F7EFC|nr:AT-hook motif nuclear-localized protein 10-like [Prosopis cineraria]